MGKKLLRRQFDLLGDLFRPGKLFAQYGTVQGQVIQDRDTGRSEASASSRWAEGRIRPRSGPERPGIRGRRLTVNEAKPREPRAGGGGGGYGGGGGGRGGYGGGGGGGGRGGSVAAAAAVVADATDLPRATSSMNHAGAPHRGS